MKTACITGATEGIGYEFARLFARKGCNLILVARNEVRLQEIVRELSPLGITVHTYAQDLSRIENARRIYEDIRKNEWMVDYLVNNAGFGIDASYTETDWEKESAMLNLNMITVAYFTKVFARDMKERRSGNILNVASLAAFQPGPYMAGYCASKAFVLSLSEAVNYELKGSGVHIAALCPGVTDTKFHAVARTEKVGMSRYLSHATAAEVAAYGYRLMENKQPVGIFGCMNKVLVFFDRFVSRSFATALSARMLKPETENVRVK